MTERTAPQLPGKLDFNTPALIRQRRVRNLKDRLAAHSIAAGGIGVIIAVMLIFFYLLYEVVPLFGGADAEIAAQYPVPGTNGQTLLLGMEEQAEIGMRVADNGQVTFFRTHDGVVMETYPLPGAEGGLTAVAREDPASHWLVAGYADGQALVFKHSYRARFDDNGKRSLTPYLEFPYGEEPIQILQNGEPITRIALRNADAGLAIAASGADGQLQLVIFAKDENFMTGEVELLRQDLKLDANGSTVHSLLVDPDLRWFFVAYQGGKMDVFDLQDTNHPVLNSRTDLVPPGVRITQVQHLLGGISVLVADDSGRVTQWFLVRDERNEYALRKIRDFAQEDAAILALAPEHRRKGFMTVDADGAVGLYNATAQRAVLSEQLLNSKPLQAVIAPRANAALIESENGQLAFLHIDNEHPEVSWSALWSEVWYENYPQPEFIWQSSAANNDFEPKFSLAPLAFGTLKAAFYAMLLAAPLAICGAMYTAFFMSAGLRRKVKPTIELMEALPTVILGFLAGLWLAPFIERTLPGIFSMLLLTPIGILVFGYLWNNAPARIRFLVPTGWDAALLIPVLILIGWFSLAMSSPLEALFFNGDMRGWLSNDLGIPYDQRNALVVGLAMGFAVIPTIFSIAEDALFSVPRHLVQGSLALGATPWQTLMRVVLPTASPGIFSGLMIGMGRAVGETMIVLMATGNTPIMDVNIFEGMRTLAANIAVEMPESEVGSTHFRILFMAAFVLFLFTFVFNTLAEVIRQRLRTKYGSL